jgi:hypothetical protein
MKSLACALKAYVCKALRWICGHVHGRGIAMNPHAQQALQAPPPILPDWLQAQFAVLRTQIAERDARLVERDARLAEKDVELKRCDLKIQQLMLELAHHKRLRFGCTSETFPFEQRELFVDTHEEDGAAIVAELAEQQAPTDAPRPRVRTGRKPLPPE